MALQQFFVEFVLVTVLGALVGVEREHTRKESKKEGVPFFGVRTTILFAILGYLLAFVSLNFGNQNLLLAGIIGLIGITTSVYLAHVWLRSYAGATTYVAEIIVVLLGVLVAFGNQINYIMAGIIAIVVTLFLTVRKKFISWTKKLETKEILSALKFGVVAFIVLPLLPNRFVDPWNTINPHQIWLVIVGVLTIYFISYILMKFFSEKGLIISSLFGGFISTTATTFQLGEWVKEKKKLIGVAVPGVFLACATGIIGKLFLVGVIVENFNLALHLLVPFAAGLIFFVVVSFIFYEDGEKVKKIELQSPFSLKPAFEFAAFYLILLVIGAVAKSYFGNLGLLAVVVFGSLYSSTTVLVSLGTMNLIGKVSLTLAVPYMVLALVISIIIKVFWASRSEDSDFIKKVIVGNSLASAVIAVVFFLQSVGIGLF